MNRKTILLLAANAFAAALLVGESVASSAITIATMPVGNAGNAADTTGFGSVRYSYNIGEYDVTSSQYTAFLNAVAATDTYGVYNSNMSGTTDGNPGITQSGSSGSYNYSVIDGRGNYPVTDVTFWDATRFANWLDNSQPSGAEGTGTTETGTYTLTATGIANNTVTRNAGATWAVTSENEWYKAAYYTPQGGTGNSNPNYWLYPTQSNTISTSQANYNFVLSDTTPVGSYTYPSYYGTYDQGGDVWQWNESVYIADLSYRGLRGGSFGNYGDSLKSDGNYYWASYPTDDSSLVGFRVSQVAFTWNNAGGSGDGVHWDTTSQNWNNSSGPALYTDTSNVVFNDANNGNYAVTLNSTVSPGPVTVNNSLGDYTISGTGGIGGTGLLTKSGTRTLTLNTVNTYTGGTTVSSGTLVAATTGSLPNLTKLVNNGTTDIFGNQTLGSLTGTGTLNVGNGTTANTVKLSIGSRLATAGGLNIAASSALDIANNHIIVSYAAGTQATADATIRGYLIAGRNGGAWNGVGGIDSSGSTGSGPSSGYSVGYADGADGVVQVSRANPSGLSTGQIEIKYTLLGDADLDGVVTGSDFTALAGNLGKSGVGWDKGDFLYTGAVTGSDFTALVSNLGKSANGADVILPASDYTAIDAFAAANGLMADVPEPSTLGLLGLAAAGVLARRRRSA